MKRLLSIVLIFAMIFSMASCGKKYTAADVVKMIDDIGEVTIESQEAIEKAENSYQSLSDEEKKNVTNYLTLYMAKQKLETLLVKAEAEKLVADGKIEEAIALIDSKGMGDSPLIKDFYIEIAHEPAGLDKGAIKNAESSQKPVGKQAIAEVIIEKWGPQYQALVSDDYSYISLPEFAEEGITYKELVRAYSRDNKIVFTVQPQTDEEHWNNIKYSILTGNWDYKQVRVDEKNEGSFDWTAFAEHGPEYQTREGQYFEAGLDPALLGSFMGGTYELIFFYQDGTYHMATCSYEIDKLPSQNEFKQYALEAYKVAKVQYDKFRAEGKISNNSSEYDKAKVWSDWLCSINMTIYEGRDNPYYMHSSSAYGALVLNSGACGSRAAAYCLAMNMEGIKSYGLVNGDPGHPGSRQGHIVPWVLLDGSEYIYEYNSRTGLLPVNKENSSAGDSPDKLHLFQEYTYNMILKRAGLDYDKSFANKKYMGNKGESLTKQNFSKNN
ncbi:MAG: hypothetical protein MJ148_01560 [Clostridia bacterium]|nr:hypothetical protein [Clostridia bacterium]